MRRHERHKLLAGDFWISVDTANVHRLLYLLNIAENKATFRLRFDWFLCVRSFEGTLPSSWTLTPNWQDVARTPDVQVVLIGLVKLFLKIIFWFFFELRSINMLKCSCWLLWKYRPSFASGVRVWAYTFKTDWCINQ